MSVEYLFISIHAASLQNVRWKASKNDLRILITLYWQIKLFALQYSITTLSANIDHHAARALTLCSKYKRSPSTAPSVLNLQPKRLGPCSPPRSTYTASWGYTTPGTSPVRKDSALLSSQPRLFVVA